MVGMKFRDIPAGQWFQDDCGRRMVKLQQSNGAVDFHYTSFRLPKDYGCERAPLSVQRLPMVNEYMHDNTMLPSFVRANESNSVNVQFNGFNAIDEGGYICRCPLDVEFYVEKPDSKDALISMLRGRIERLRDDLCNMSCAINDVRDTCNYSKAVSDSYTDLDEGKYNRLKGASELANELLDLLEQNDV
jgi:hypothetical protein